MMFVPKNTEKVEKKEYEQLRWFRQSATLSGNRNLVQGNKKCAKGTKHVPIRF